ncbi:MAG: hypothetical protein CML31_05255 [Rhizobiales bacterium]|nr:hypothetical protein [Hoeflea sp.]MBG19360.1 hypothetical protein [Hyphomicrobiales bacterium]|tara:strand:- start:400 stop:681 length:282 start_codon:yes stop_codon:yes gene_type:complete
MTKCKHEEFMASVSVARLTDEKAGPVTGYTASVKVHCAQCGVEFRFIGVPAGNHYAEPRVSVDGTELRAPIEPAEHTKFAPTASYAMPPRGKH